MRYQIIRQRWQCSGTNLIVRYPLHIYKQLRADYYGRHGHCDPYLGKLHTLRSLQLRSRPQADKAVLDYGKDDSFDAPLPMI